MALVICKLTHRNFGKACSLLGPRILYRPGTPIVCHRKLCSLADSAREDLLVKQTEDRVTARHKNSDELSCDALLSAIDSKNSTLGSSLSILNTLADLTTQGRIESSLYSQDQRFQQFCEQLQDQMQKFNHVHIVTALRCLLEMHLDPESRTVQLFENEVLWRIRKMTFKTLSICLHFHCRHTKTKMQKNVCSELVNAIKARWVEIRDADDVIKNLEKASLFDEEFLSRLEERALLVTDKMSLEQLYKLCLAMANSKRRSTPLLRSISYHFTRSTEKLNEKQTINMLHSLNVLNFSDSGILHKLTSDILPSVPTMKENMIFSLLTTTGQLRWRYPDLLQSCCDWILSNYDSCRTQELVSCILTLAALNYKPEQEEVLFSKILPKLNRQSVNADTVWLDNVFSLAILSRATAEHLNSVLSPSFYGTVCEMSAFQDADTLNKLKLLTSNAVAKLEVPSAKFSRELEHVFNNIQIPQSELMRKCRESVISSLSNFLPPEKFMATNLNTSLGFLIDAEFILDKNGKPVPLEQYGVRAGIRADLKPLPAGCSRVALLIWNQKDFTLCTSSLCGKNALTVRLLKTIGYKVVEIPYEDFLEHKTVVKKVQFLQQKINEKCS